MRRSQFSLLRKVQVSHSALVVLLLASAATAADTSIEAVSAEPTTSLIEAPPSRTFGGILRALSRNRDFNVAMIEREVENRRDQTSNGLLVSTLVESVSYDCRANSDDVPDAIWSMICNRGGHVERYYLSGDPGVYGVNSQQLSVINGHESSRFLYYIDQFRIDTENLELHVREVTPEYEQQWSGHFPFLDQVFLINIDHTILLVTTERSASSRERVLSMTIFTRR